MAVKTFVGTSRNKAKESQRKQWPTEANARPQTAPGLPEHSEASEEQHQGQADRWVDVRVLANQTPLALAALILDELLVEMSRTVTQQES